MSIKQVTAAEITKKILNKDKLFILDVRNKVDFADWKIEGENIEHLNVPYVELIDGVDGIIDQLPKNEPITVVCAKAGSAKMVAEKLVTKGFETSYLAGGMRKWSEHLEPIKIGDLDNGGEIYQFVRIGKGCLSYMVLSNGEAAVIDPVRFVDVFLDFAKAKDVKITHVLDTHLHADHISGGRLIREATGADYWLPPKDAAEVTYEYNALEDGHMLKIGQSKIDIKPLYSPGHTIGSTSFIVDDTYLLTGDTLFIDSIGRPDLAGLATEWVDDLRETLYTLYRQLSENLIVLPGHFMIIEELNDDGSVSEKLGKLFAENHGLNIKSDEEFRKTVTEGLPPQPNAFKDIRQVNMGKIKLDEEKQVEMEIGPNRCAIR